MWKYKTLKNLYYPNIYPVIWNNIRGDGVTLPPTVKRSLGRPKKRRYRRRTQQDGMPAITSAVVEQVEQEFQVDNNNESDDQFDNWV